MAQKILIVDDDEYLRDLYKEVLSDAGYEVDAVDNGENGLLKLEDGGYDLTLLDVVMPKLDGLGVLKKLKESSPKNPNGPIVLLTNLAHDPIVQEALNLGAARYIIKTDITPDQLVEEVKKTLGI